MSSQAHHRPHLPRVVRPERPGKFAAASDVEAVERALSQRDRGRRIGQGEYAVPKQREGGVTLSLASNAGEVEWLGRDILRTNAGDTLRFLNDEYMEIRDRYPGEFAPMANAHALEESCREAVEDVLARHEFRGIAASSSYGDGVLRAAIELCGIDRVVFGTDFGPVPYGVRARRHGSDALFGLGLEALVLSPRIVQFVYSFLPTETTGGFRYRSPFGCL